MTTKPETSTPDPGSPDTSTPDTSSPGTGATDAAAPDRKVVLVTGANKGIGLATARELGRAGLTVLLGARDPGRGTAAARELADEGLDAVFVRLDVTDAGVIAAAAAFIAQAYGRLDILVNNAGISRDRPHSPAELPVAALRETYETNVFGVVAVTNAMLPLLRQSTAGYIGNVSSGLGTIAFLTDPESPWWPYANLLGYNSSKAALNAITLIYAHSLRDAGIKVNALSPGFVATDLNSRTGTDTVEQAGTRIARQVLLPGDGPTGVFLRESGGTYPW